MRIDIELILIYWWEFCKIYSFMYTNHFESFWDEKFKTQFERLEMGSFADIFVCLEDLSRSLTTFFKIFTWKNALVCAQNFWPLKNSAEHFTLVIRDEEHVQMKFLRIFLDNCPNLISQCNSLPGKPPSLVIKDNKLAKILYSDLNAT